MFDGPSNIFIGPHFLQRYSARAAAIMSRSGEWTVAGPKSQPRLLLKRSLDEVKRTSKVERMESEKKKLAEVLLTAARTSEAKD
jgi:hypothetical protein